MTTILPTLYGQVLYGQVLYSTQTMPSIEWIPIGQNAVGNEWVEVPQYTT